MGWVGDAIQLAMGSDTFWKGIALILLGYFGWQMHLGLQKVLLQLEQANVALVKNGKPISITGELTALEQAVQSSLARLEERLDDACTLEETLFENQKENIEAFRFFREEPWRFCGKFSDCPAVIRKNEHVLRTETMMKENYEKATKDREEIKAQVKTVADQVVANREVLTAFVENFAKEMMLMLREKEELGRKR